MNHVYLDLNVFDKIEKKETLKGEEKKWFDHLYNQIETEEILTPYSNAHISDLKRGYVNNANLVNQHMQSIKKLSNDLCIVNYWGDQGVTWHYRDIEEFFESSLADLNSSTFEEFLNEAEFGFIYRMQLLPKKFEKLPDNFRLIADSNPLLKTMYPLAYGELTEYAPCEDIFNLNSLLTKDYTLFKKMKGLIVEHRQKLKKQEKLFKLIEQMETIPESLKFDAALDIYIEKLKTSKNPQYQNVTTAYFRMNFDGFKADSVFANSVDDGIHVYYGSHCDYFVTGDDKCHYKAGKVYKQLRIDTKVVTPEEYYKLTIK